VSVNQESCWFWYCVLMFIALSSVCTAFVVFGLCMCFLVLSVLQPSDNSVAVSNSSSSG
jgi:hypothetical protein